ncbi:MAG: HNH endonuclease [Candidatus Electronema aureum]|uniref:HNH endonuclease n=1 Tax=Candidatus Electronema aureum TaxID=2005002 RepID=A0A521FZN2_9BACT|nr:MAG: HNH endonuclease [Candidatus Electronema aureum]
MTVKCKVERLLTDVHARMKDHYNHDRYRYNYIPWTDNNEDEDFIVKMKELSEKHQADIEEESGETMQVLSDSEISPSALYENSCIFRALESSLFLVSDRYKYINSQFFLFRDSIYAATGPYTESECMLLVAKLADKERKLFEGLSQKQDSPEVREAVANRKRISEEVRIAVWRRDQGQCAKCGSRLNLEYDHIIPVAEGGSNTVRNIELLCEKCNRAKGKKIQ